jgi:hypothetical protein
MNTIHYGTIIIEHNKKRVEVKEAIYRAGATIYHPFKNPFKEPVPIVTCDLNCKVVGGYRKNN